MNILSIEKLTKYYGTKKLFEEVSLGIEDGQKIALIGTNGTGKSTFLKIISNQAHPDEGNITWRKGIKINFLEQVPTFKPEDTISEHIFNSDSEKVQLIKKYELCCEKINHNYDESVEEELKYLTERMDVMDAWQYEHEIKSILSELHINDLTLKMSSLSGGTLKKVALAQCLIDEADFLILDEPTNHLDIKSIEWLESFLKRSNKSILLVTHDRYLVDNVCNTIFEISLGKIWQVDGNYSKYLEKKEELESTMLNEEQRVKSVLRVELEWLKRGAKARSTKQKARIQRAHDLINREKYKPEENIEISISGRKLGKKILEVDNISKSYENRLLFKGFSHKFKQNERIGIVGSNASGKSTFLKILTGHEQPDIGNVDKGINTHFGFFDQYSMNLKPEMTALDYIKDSALHIEISNGKTLTASQMMERFLFQPSVQHTPIEKLSGGEKRRLYLLYILMQNPNFLILDEPTNDFDIKTLSVLEDFLNEFKGCLLVVSHDRYFMDRIVDYLFLLEGDGQIKQFTGNYSEYLEEQKELQEQEVQAVKKSVAEKENKPKEKVKLSFNEQQELKKLEKDIDKLEIEKKELDELFSSGQNDFDSISKWNKRYKEIEESLLTKMERWEYLASF
jgi:ATP-binding cassette subfamily F protein uup